MLFQKERNMLKKIIFIIYLCFSVMCYAADLDYKAQSTYGHIFLDVICFENSTIKAMNSNPAHRFTPFISLSGNKIVDPVMGEIKLSNADMQKIFKTFLRVFLINTEEENRSILNGDLTEKLKVINKVRESYFRHISIHFDWDSFTKFVREERFERNRLYLLEHGGHLSESIVPLRIHTLITRITPQELLRKLIEMGRFRSKSDGIFSLELIPLSEDSAEYQYIIEGAQISFFKDTGLTISSIEIADKTALKFYFRLPAIDKIEDRYYGSYFIDASITVKPKRKPVKKTASATSSQREALKVQKEIPQSDPFHYRTSTKQSSKGEPTKT